MYLRSRQSFVVQLNAGASPDLVFKTSSKQFVRLVSAFGVLALLKNFRQLVLRTIRIRVIIRPAAKLD